MARAPLVLIVSEHEWASRSLDSVLAPRGYGVLRAYTARQAIERAAGTDVDAVFVDRQLPDATGAEICRDMIERGVVSRAAPIILVAAGTATRLERLDAMRAGAWEVITLPVDAEELLLRVDRFIRAKMEADEAHHDALIDAVTGLYTWAGIARRIGEVAAAAERSGRPLACVVLAPAGEGAPLDETEEDPVAAFAERLRGATRRSDVLGRIGPREFAIIAPDTTPEGAQTLARRLRAQSIVNGGGSRAGVCAITNIRDAGLDPLDLLIQATLASRETPPSEFN